MTIKNLDREVKNEMEMKEQFLNAMNSGNEEEMAKAFTNFANAIQQNIIKEAKSIVNEDLTDRQVLANRGLQVLTKEETTYYNEVISGNGFGGTEKLVPATVIDRVFEDLVHKHELLQYIDFVNVTGITEWITKNGDVPTAFWGKLTSAISEILDEGFQKISTEQYKLSAFLPVAKAMLKLGPVFLDKYVRTVLAEAIAIGLEDAIVKGTGKDQPIGMIKNLAGAVVDGVYPDKTAKAITDLSPETLGTEVMAPLTRDGKRVVSEALLVVNPNDYWSKVFPATTVLTQNGTYVHGVLPIPAKVVQSVSVPQGKMVAGVASDYFLGMGARQTIEVSNEVRFIEDESVYLAKLYANGRPKDNASFLVFDISGVGTPQV
ncbi:phage major capsid protein [Schinkia azotoformans]|uniref:phage major capsid protein n=1 Tax=Schinkia azotoformans TaxID=1454 RepID=UPI002DB763F2|nr:phage major capsid protein [Schinkia azotoformans]MEC1778407.1 phage major capsid protein [Schinkia azotoformans]MED4328348.1 phage major capsid protein [Schinkia azotoformans]